MPLLLSRCTTPPPFPSNRNQCCAVPLLDTPLPRLQERRPAQSLAASAAVLAASVLLATTAVTEPALAANMRLKGTAGSGQAEEKYMSGLELKKLQSSRRKEALAKRCCSHLRVIASPCNTL